MKRKWKLLSCVQLFATPWTIQSMEFSRPKCWSELPFPSPGDLPNPGIKPMSPALQMDFLLLSHQGRNALKCIMNMLKWIVSQCSRNDFVKGNLAILLFFLILPMHYELPKRFCLTSATSFICVLYVKYHSMLKSILLFSFCISSSQSATRKCCLECYRHKSVA